MRTHVLKAPDPALGVFAWSYRRSGFGYVPLYTKPGCGYDEVYGQVYCGIERPIDPKQFITLHWCANFDLLIDWEGQLGK